MIHHRQTIQRGKALGFWLILCSALLVSGCGVIRTKVNTFKAPQWAPNGGSIVVKPLDEALAPSLEFAHYRKVLEQELSQLGFTVSDESKAQYVAMLDYHIEEAVNDDDGPRTSVYLGSGTGPRYGSHTSVVLADDNDRPVYRRSVMLVIAQNDQEQKRFYEVKGLSLGRCSVLSKVFTPIIQAMLKNFPAADGDVQNIPIEGSESC